MPVNRKYPLSELTAACEYYLQKKIKMITLEYILIAGVNDGLDQVKPLAALARKLNAKVNLIPHNPADPLPYQPSPATRVEMFKSILESKGVHAFIRKPRGRDIFAACGQLAAITQTAVVGAS